jgi:hypothetical protein
MIDPRYKLQIVIIEKSIIQISENIRRKVKYKIKLLINKTNLPFWKSLKY